MPTCIVQNLLVPTFAKKKLVASSFQHTMANKTRQLWVSEVMSRLECLESSFFNGVLWRAPIFRFFKMLFRQAKTEIFFEKTNPFWYWPFLYKKATFFRYPRRFAKHPHSYLITYEHFYCDFRFWFSFSCPSKLRFSSQSQLQGYQNDIIIGRV